MNARMQFFRLLLAGFCLAGMTNGKAEPVGLEKIQNAQGITFQIAYQHLPITLSLPGLDAINSQNAKLEMGLGSINYCDEFQAVKNPLDQALGVSKGNLNFLVPETVAELILGVGDYVFKGDLQVVKEVCEYEGEQYALYHLVAGSGFSLEAPITEELLKKLQSSSSGTLEIKYSNSKGFDTDGVLAWDASEIRNYAIAALQSLTTMRIHN